ncbi:MAG: amidohydrolase family protein [bacterium]
MQIYHGPIIACDSAGTVNRYLVEDQGRILFTGNELPQSYEGAAVTELGGRALLPAFGDGHLHFSSWALVAEAFFDVRTAQNFEELGERILAFAKDGAQTKIVTAFGASKHSVAEKRLITREELDAIYSDRPVYIICYDGHSSIGNTKLIEYLPDRVKAMRGFDGDKGHLFHEAYYGATDYVSKTVPTLMLIRSILKGYDRLAENGVGLMHAAEGIGFPRDMDVALVSLIARAMAKKRDYQTRIFFQTLAVEKALKRKLPRIGGCFATALDGCFGVMDAALVEPYANDPENKGILFHEDQQVIDFAKAAQRAGLQISVHAIGDAAVEQALTALEAAQRDCAREDTRHIIIHACLLSDRSLDRAAELGVGITSQAGFLISPLEPPEYLEEILGSRVAMSSPFRSITDRGIHFSGGSDAPVCPPNPFLGIQGLCNHPYDAGQSLTVQQALRAYTHEVAWMSFDDQDRGTLEQGKIADMVIVDGNPLETKAAALGELKTEQLLVAGKPYRPAMGVLGALLSGMTGKRMKI